MPSIKTGRLDAVDFTKGALVLFMVLYHWLNYFVGPNIDYRYLRFLTPSFVFITGFLISHVYLSKYDGSSNRLTQRLLTRGLKLLVIFIVLNVVKSVMGDLNSTVRGGQDGPANLVKAFVLGPTGAEKIVSFYILVPISYVLLCSAALVKAYRYSRYVFHTASAFLLMAIMLLHLAGLHSTNLEYIALGMLGAVSGLVRMGAIDSIARQHMWLGLAYLTYVAAITLWNVPFGLLVVGVCLTLLSLYEIGARSRPSVAQKHVILLGQYSLFGYIVQIAILQLLSGIWRHLQLGQLGIYLSFIAAFALTMLAVELLAAVKEKSIMVERLYRAALA
jgi:peptidoglycan/LPS O-acetylase OafA/YrhL